MAGQHGGADRALYVEVDSRVRGAIQRTITKADEYDAATITALLANELASHGLYLDDDWLLTVAEAISRGETPPVHPIRFARPHHARRRARRRGALPYSR